MHAYTYVHMHIHTHKHTYTHMHTCKHACMGVRWMNLDPAGCFEARGLVPRPSAKAVLEGGARDTGGTCDGYVRVMDGL